MAMGYLFGDSTTFPLPFDFLRTLEAFMAAGTRVILVEDRARGVAAEVLAAEQERAEGLGALEGFHATVVPSLDGAGVPSHAFAVDYAHKLSERASSLLEERRRAVKDADQQGQERARAERTRANDEEATHLTTFFRTARLPTLETHLATTLVDGRPSASAQLTHPEGVGVSFTLGTAKAPAWSGPRKVSELAGHVELTVGIKKSWIGGKISREPVRLDDWVIGSAELWEARATIAIRKKPDQKDTLVFQLRRDGEAFAADVEHPGDPNAELVPAAAEVDNLPHLERLWTALRASFDEILEERAAVTTLSLDGAEATQSGRGQELVERIVTILAPTALEIARRSPNARELSLKREGKDGRREELYLRRADLVEKLSPLPRAGRAIFGPLGLEEWVPAMSMKPPPVAVAEVREELSSLDFDEK